MDWIRKHVTPTTVVHDGRPVGPDGVVLGKVVVDQFYSKEQNLGLSGLPANDVSLLQRASSQLELEMLQARMSDMSEQRKAHDARNKGKSDADLMAELQPKSCQTPAEIAAFVESQTLRQMSQGKTSHETKSNETNSQENETNSQTNETNSQNANVTMT